MTALSEGAAAWRALPAERRANLLDYLRDEVKQQRAQADAWRVGDPALVADHLRQQHAEQALAWAEENEAALRALEVLVEPADLNLNRMADAAIREAMRRAEGHPQPAARALGVSRSTLYRHLRRLGIPVAGQTSAAASVAGKASGKARSVRPSFADRLDDAGNGFRWAYVECRKHGTVGRYRYQPHSLSQPVMGAMSCGCSANRRDGEVKDIDRARFDEVVGATEARS